MNAMSVYLCFNTNELHNFFFFRFSFFVAIFGRKIFQNEHTQTQEVFCVKVKKQDRKKSQELERSIQHVTYKLLTR